MGRVPFRMASRLPSEAAPSSLSVVVDDLDTLGTVLCPAEQTRNWSLILIECWPFRSPAGGGEDSGFAVVVELPPALSQLGGHSLTGCATPVRAARSTAP